ncbi:MAG: hypothetical protein ACE5JG_04550 [Planctomycetota bacterium]
MLLARAGSPPASAPWVAGLSLLFLAGIAFTIPPAAIRAATGERRGALVGVGTLSDRLAELRAGEGYSFVAVDLSRANLAAGAPWRTHVKRVRARRFPLWGWVATGAGREHVEAILRGAGPERPPVALDGLFVYGGDAPRFAERLRRTVAAAPEIVPVVGDRDPRPASGRFGVVLDEAGFPGTDIPLPVLRGARLDYARIEGERGEAAGGYLVAFVTLD